MTTKVLRTMVLLVLVLNLVPQTATAALGQARHKQTIQTLQIPQQNTSYRSALLQNQINEVTEDASALAAGSSHTCALTSDGGIKCWGFNGWGQLGDGTTTDRSTPVDVAGLSSGVTALAAGYAHTCALTSNGGVKCWGENGYGQLGDGTTTRCNIPVDVVGLSSGVITLTAGRYHTCALTTNGGVKCWGFNGYGQLGDGTTTDRSTPVDVVGFSIGAGALTADQTHTCALTTSGGVKCWGDNTYGQLGDGTTTQRSTPVDVIGLSSGVDGVAAGSAHTCVLTSSGGVKCWGANGSGQLGDGTDTDRSTPVDVVSLGSGVDGVAAGGSHTCALTNSGGAKCWGNNGIGQLGDGTTTSSTTSVDVVGLSSGVIALAAGSAHTCALTSNGGVKCWGSNSFRQLGNGAITRHNTPVDVVGLSNGADGVAASGSHTCALTTSGGVKCWGLNLNGRLGDGTTVPRSTPVDVVGLSSGVIALTAGDRHTCALTISGGVKCWGYNSSGQLGDGTTIQRSTPVDVVGLSSGVVALAAGGYHTCALTSSGGVKCWGGNYYGQLGDGSTTSSATPVDVVGLSSGVIALTAGGRHTCALTISGGVKCWGDNWWGQLGDGTTTQRNMPVDVVGLSSGVDGVAAGGSHTCALTSDGGVKCWGDNFYGQLGDGTITRRNTPVDVVGLSNGVDGVAAGSAHTCALTTSGGVKCWGANGAGQLGDGTTTDRRSTPVDVVSLSSGVTALAAGSAHTCVLTANGGVKCWGYDNYGQLGLGTIVYSTTPVDVVGFEESPLFSAINGFAFESNARLDQVLAEAQHVAYDGDYFAIERQKDQIQLVADAVLGTVTVFAVPFDSVGKVKDLTKMETPGIAGSGWEHIIQLRDQYQPAADAFRKVLFEAPLTAETASLASQEFLKGTLIYFAADITDQAAEELVTDAAIASGIKIGLQSDLGLQTNLYPGLEELYLVFQQDINDTAASAVIQLPPLSPEEEQAYLDDFVARKRANVILAFTLGQRALPLHIAQDDREYEPGGIVPWLTEFLIKYLLKSGALACCDGPGVLAVELGALYADTHENVERLEEDIKMMMLSTDVLGGALCAQKRIYLNTVNGIDNVVNQIPPQIADVNLTSVNNISIGEYKVFGHWWWWERSSHSEVTLANATDSDTLFQVIADYEHSGFLGTSLELLVAEGVTSVNGSQSGVVYVRYKNDEQGISPDDDSNISMSVLGSTDTGTYWIMNTSTTWQPTRITPDDQAAYAKEELQDIQEDEIETLPYPIRATIDTMADNLTYIPRLWIENPFTFTLNATITQPLPINIQVVDTYGTILIGQNLVWSRVISPETIVEITHTIAYSGASGITVTYPTAELQISDGISKATFAGNPVSFKIQTPLAGEALPPYEMGVNETFTVPITITNRASSTVSGTVHLELTDVNGIVMHEVSQDIDVAALDRVYAPLPVLAPENGGYYVLSISVDSNGGEQRISANFVKVSHSVYLPLVQK